MTKHLRLRFKLHKGTNEEVAIDLGDYGMSKPSLPESLGGSYKFEESFVDWVEDRLELETALEIALKEQHEELVKARASMTHEEGSMGNFDHDVNVPHHDQHFSSAYDADALHHGHD